MKQQPRTPLITIEADYRKCSAYKEVRHKLTLRDVALLADYKKYTASIEELDILMRHVLNVQPQSVFLGAIYEEVRHRLVCKGKHVFYILGWQTNADTYAVKALYVTPYFKSIRSSKESKGGVGGDRHHSHGKVDS